MSKQLRFGGHRRRGPGFRVTGRDKEIVRWIGRVRIAQAAQVSERCSLGRAVTYTRLSGLVRLGLLEHARVFHAVPGVYLATREGLAPVDVALPPARIDLRTYTHDLQLSSLVIELEREFGIDRVRTEREMRATDAWGGTVTADRPSFAVPLHDTDGRLHPTPTGHARLHFPDAAVVDSTDIQREAARALAVELERTPKGPARLRRILAGYISARHIVSVRYYVSGDRVRSLLEAEVHRLRAQRLIDVREW